MSALDEFAVLSPATTTLQQHQQHVALHCIGPVVAHLALAGQMSTASLVIDAFRPFLDNAARSASSAVGAPLGGIATPLANAVSPFDSSRSGSPASSSSSTFGSDMAHPHSHSHQQTLAASTAAALSHAASAALLHQLGLILEGSADAGHLDPTTLKKQQPLQHQEQKLAMQVAAPGTANSAVTLAASAVHSAVDGTETGDESAALISFGGQPSAAVEAAPAGSKAGLPYHYQAKQPIPNKYQPLPMQPVQVPAPAPAPGTASVSAAFSFSIPSPTPMSSSSTPTPSTPTHSTPPMSMPTSPMMQAASAALMAGSSSRPSVMTSGHAHPSTHYHPHASNSRSDPLGNGGPLAQYLAGKLAITGPDDAANRMVWRDAFIQEWQGELAHLPDVMLTTEDVAFIKSRAMYFRLCDRFPDADNQRILENVPLARMWLNAVHLRHPSVLGLMAIVGGHTSFLDHLLKEGLVTVAELDAHPEMGKYRDSVVNLAAAAGHVDVLTVLLETGGGKCTAYTMNVAANNGHLDVVKYLHVHRREGCTSAAMDCAAQYGHLDVVQWLHANRTEGCTKDAMNWAAEAGHLDVVQWLHAQRLEGCTTKAIRLAARNGHTDMVRFLLEKRREGFTVDAVNEAATDAIGNLLVKSLGDMQRREMLKEAMDGHKETAVRRLLLI